MDFIERMSGFLTGKQEKRCVPGKGGWVYNRGMKECKWQEAPWLEHVWREFGGVQFGSWVGARWDGPHVYNAEEFKLYQ